MNKVTLILSVIMTVALVLWLAPGVFAMNQGKTLRNIALWLAIFTGLGLVYKNFGPDSEHPLFSIPEGVNMRTPGQHNEPHRDKAEDDKADGSQGFTPPAD